MAVQNRHAPVANSAHVPSTQQGASPSTVSEKGRDPPSMKERDPPSASLLAQRFISEFWPSFSWWATVILSVPFAAYAMIYVLAYEPAIREFSADKQDGFPDVGTYSQGTLDHMPLWQIHSLCALVYIVTAPLQFIDRLRLTRVAFHRASGYAFLVSGVVLAATGVVMSFYSEMAPGFIVVSAFLSPAWLFAAGNAMWNIKKRRMQAHREWMIRTAAIGFSVIYLRPLSPLLRSVMGFTNREATVTAAWISLILSIVGSQLYIELRYHGYGGHIPTKAHKSDSGLAAFKCKGDSDTHVNVEAREEKECIGQERVPSCNGL